MGIPIQIAKLLLEQVTSNDLKGSVLQLGLQDILFDLSIFEGKSTLSKEVQESAENNIRKNKYFFNFLGFNNVESLDINDFEGANIIHDLNTEYENVNIKYNVIFDGGTMEHVFNIPIFLKNCLNLCTIDGHIIHNVPVNHINHGFYNFNPTLFEDFYVTNGCAVIDILLVIKDIYDNVTYVTDASKKSAFRELYFEGMFKNKNLSLFIIVKKINEVQGISFPTQSYYQNINNNAKYTTRFDRYRVVKRIYSYILTLNIISKPFKIIRNLIATKLINLRKID